jgi:hypothetical protein
MPPERVMLLSCADWAAGAVLSELRRGGSAGAPMPLVIVLRRVPDDGLVECDWRAEGRRTLPNMTVSGWRLRCAK